MKKLYLFLLIICLGQNVVAQTIKHSKTEEIFEILNKRSIANVDTFLLKKSYEFVTVKSQEIGKYAGTFNVYKSLTSNDSYGLVYVEKKLIGLYHSIFNEAIFNQMKEDVKKRGFKPIENRGDVKNVVVYGAGDYAFTFQPSETNGLKMFTIQAVKLSLWNYYNRP